MFTFQNLSSSPGLSILKAPKDGIRTRNQKQRSLVWKSPWLESTVSPLSSLQTHPFFSAMSVLITSSQTLSHGSGPAPVATSCSGWFCCLWIHWSWVVPQKSKPPSMHSHQSFCVKQNRTLAPQSARALNASLVFGRRLRFLLPFLPPSHCLLFMPYFLISWIFFSLKKYFKWQVSSPFSNKTCNNMPGLH